MKIAQIAPLIESVPPRLYGGTERIVSYLTEELVALGHDVTLFASGDSITTADLVHCVPRALRLDASVRDCKRVGEDDFMLDVAGQGWSGHCRAATPLSGGEPVVVMMRPENLRVAQNGAKPANGEIALSGRVVDTIFRGAYRSVVLDSDAGRLNVDVSALLDAPIGANLTFMAEQGAAWAIRP